MSKLQLAHELESIETGKYYLVAHALLDATDSGYKENVLVPIFPIKHRDPQFGKVGALYHYHVDGRFYSGFLNFMGVYEGLTNNVIVAEENEMKTYRFLKIVYKRRTCKRQSTGFMTRIAQYSNKWTKWADTMVGKSCKGKICPHYGAQMLVTDDGKYRCPIHNLLGCPKTEKIIISHNVIKNN